MLSKLLSCLGGCNSNDTQCDHNMARDSKFISISTSNESLMLGSKTTTDRFLVSCCYLKIVKAHLSVLMMVETPGSLS
jgi:hypothetical protein